MSKGSLLIKSKFYWFKEYYLILLIKLEYQLNNYYLKNNSNYQLNDDSYKFVSFSIKFSEFLRINVFKTSFSWVNNVFRNRLNWNSFSRDFNSILLGLNLFSIICLNSLNEGKSASWLSYMFNSNVNSLWNDSSIVLFVDNDSYSVLSNIENSSCFAMIAFVWHTFMDWTIS